MKVLAGMTRVPTLSAPAERRIITSVAKPFQGAQRVERCHVF